MKSMGRVFKIKSAESRRERKGNDKKIYWKKNQRAVRWIKAKSKMWQIWKQCACIRACTRAHIAQLHCVRSGITIRRGPLRVLVICYTRGNNITRSLVYFLADTKTAAFLSEENEISRFPENWLRLSREISTVRDPPYFCPFHELTIRCFPDKRRTHVHLYPCFD